jgi:hypothetical protein
MHVQFMSLLPSILKYPDWLCTPGSQSFVSTDSRMMIWMEITVGLVS